MKPRGWQHPFFILYGALALAAAAAHAQTQGDAKRGLYVSKAGGCFGCHTEPRPNAQPYAGRRARNTPFGTLFGPNNTPHPLTGNWLGAPKKGRFLAGAKLGEKTKAPNLTPTRLKKLSDAELRDILRTGVSADGDVLSESMAEVVQNTTSQLTPQDLDALVAYLRSLPPLPEEPR